MLTIHTYMFTVHACLPLDDRLPGGVVVVEDSQVIEGSVVVVVVIIVVVVAEPGHR